MTKTAKLVRRHDWRRDSAFTGDAPTGEIEYYPFKGSHELLIECELVHPPSSKGQKVLIHLSPDDITDLLLLMRQRAIRMRQKGMG